MRAWIRHRLPTWAQLLLLSRTIAGGLLTLLGVLAEHDAEVRALLGALPWLQPWHVSVAGAALVIYARARDAYTRQNPA